MSIDLLEKLINCCFAVVPRVKPEVKQSEICLIAHRGAHNNAEGIIENTMEAFLLAEQAGCWGIEFDVRATADKVLVVNHDPTLKRLWGRNLTIADLTFAELRAQVPEIPTLSEVIAEFGLRLHLFIELKTPFQEEAALLSVLEGLTAGKDYHLITLTSEVFKSLHHFPKNALLLVSSYNNTRHFCDISLQENYGGLLGHYLLLTDPMVEQLHAAKQLTGVGFVDSKYSLYRELSRGMHWVFTNQAVKVAPWVQELVN